MANIAYQPNHQLKFTSIVSYNEKQPMHYAELPPTPSSSTLSFKINEKDDTLLDREEASILEQSSFRSYSTHYGSIESSSSSKSTTISPHDDDEGLYLYWTNQLLKERGYEPSPLKRLIIEEEEDNDNDSIASSISDLSTHTVYQRKSWLFSWFPFC